MPIGNYLAKARAHLSSAWKRIVKVALTSARGMHFSSSMKVTSLGTTATATGRTSTALRTKKPRVTGTASPSPDTAWLICRHHACLQVGSFLLVGLDTKQSIRQMSCRLASSECPCKARQNGQGEHEEGELEEREHGQSQENSRVHKAGAKGTHVQGNETGASYYTLEELLVSIEGAACAQSKKFSEAAQYHADQD